MRAGRSLGLVAAVALSLGVHLAGAGLLVPEPVELEGGGEPAPARLGTSFADMVQGAPGRTRPDLADPANVEEAAVSPVRPAEAVVASEPEAASPSATEPGQPQDPAQATSPAEATATSLAVAVPAAPSVAQPTTGAAPPEVMVADDEAALTPLSSPRPRARPEGLAPSPPEPEPEVAAPQAPAASGNAAANATRGSTTGAEAAEATATAPAPQPAPQAGNGAAVANYPGEVLRRISRAGRPRVRHNGPDVVIAFRINGGGGLAGLSVARSSGNPELDQAGLSIVQRAAPFPAPPPGAQTSFSINFGGR